MLNVNKYYSQITEWLPAKDQMGDDILYGYIDYIPFDIRYKKGDVKKIYRLLVKKKIRPDGQINCFTEDAYDYHSVITNDMTTDILEALQFYYHRGSAENTFDVLKNDFGWNHLPFSHLSQNTVYLYLSALINNMNGLILEVLSSKYNVVNKRYRMKRFIFKFITKPAKWLYRSRRWQLNLYGNLQV